MTHPEELLSGYVDGTLPNEERAVVDAHLATCATCREEVELAGEALVALEALEEQPVPFGVTGPVMAEAGRRFERRGAVWQRVQWGAGLAAAAAIVLVVALNLSGDSANRATDPTEGTAEAGAGAPGAAFAADDARLPRLEEQRAVNYDDGGIHSLAQDAKRSAEAESSPTVGSDTVGRDIEFAAQDERGVALECLRTSGAPLDDPLERLDRLIEAQYRGTPAYFAVFLESPGGGQPPDSAIVWVVATRDCRILTLASLPL
ncbi:MAG: zf-HC2 domain-containing protein [Actinomycetota bacterium]